MAETKTEKKEGAVKKPAEKKPEQPNPIVRYFRETRGELRKVTWPTRDESQRLTLIVLGVTVLMAVFLGLLDFTFSNTIQALVNWMIGF